MKCKNCESEISEANNFCPDCGSAVVKGDSFEGKTNEGSAFSNMSKFKKVGLGASLFAVGLIGVALFSSGNSGSTPSSQITVEEFYCSFGTQVASTVISSSASETVYAFVTVGLYGSEGTLQHTATNYAYVEPGGTSLVNVSLSPYMYTVGDCRVMNAGH